MIRVSDLLRVLDLPPGSTGILTQIAERLGGDFEMDIPGMPPIPAHLPEIPAPLKAAAKAALGKCQFEFYQTVGMRVNFGGVSIGGIGARLSETLTPPSATPAIKITPVLEFAPKG